MKWEEKALRTRLEGKRLLYILLFGAYFWPQCMIMYPSLQKCWEHWPPKPHSRPQSPSFLGHEVLVRYKLGRVACGQEFQSPSRRETGLVPVGNWTKYRKFSIKHPRMLIEFKHIWWEGGALIFAGYPFYFLFTSTICQTAQLHASLGCILMTHRSLMQMLMWIQYS